MKVRDHDGISRGIPQSSKPAHSGKLESGSSTASGGPIREDRVELSDRARALQVANESISTLQVIRKDRVESLKQSIKDGSYHVPGEKIAERMLGEGLFA